MGEMNLKEVLVFLDDIIVFSKTLEEHEVRLMKVLARLREFGLKLSPEKCTFFQLRSSIWGISCLRTEWEPTPEKWRH